MHNKVNETKSIWKEKNKGKTNGLWNEKPTKPISESVSMIIAHTPNTPTPYVLSHDKKCGSTDFYRIFSLSLGSVLASHDDLSCLPGFGDRSQGSNTN